MPEKVNGPADKLPPKVWKAERKKPAGLTAVVKNDDGREEFGAFARRVSFRNRRGGKARMGATGNRETGDNDDLVFIEWRVVD
jgi:hypothetical protein